MDSEKKKQFSLVLLVYYKSILTSFYSYNTLQNYINLGHFSVKNIQNYIQGLKKIDFFEH